MFTGIIEGLGTITGIRPAGGGRRLTLRAEFDLDGTRIGDSICVSGACLTAVAVEGRTFAVDVSPETLSRSTFPKAAVGERVNLERALRLSDRLDGHLVSGHLDGTGVLTSRQTEANAVILGFSAPPAVVHFLIEKGSVAVDGISLTINRCDDLGFTVSIIPHTAGVTTIGIKKIGEPVNLEADLIGKYVARFVHRASSGTSPTVEGGKQKDSLDRDFLARFGFV
jgi:riboflavin synthase